MAGLARHRARHTHRGFGAAIGLIERDLEIEAQVLAAHVGAPAARPATGAAEHLVEDVAEYRAEIEALAVEAARAVGAGATFESGRSVAIVGGALLGILQDVVGVIEFLELLFGVLVAGIAVGVVLHGELAERLFEVVGACRTTDAQQLVVVLSHIVLRSPHLPLVT